MLNNNSKCLGAYTNVTCPLVLLPRDQGSCVLYFPQQCSAMHSSNIITYCIVLVGANEWITVFTGVIGAGHHA